MYFLITEILPVWKKQQQNPKSCLNLVPNCKNALWLMF